MHAFAKLILAAVVVLLSACATGPKHDEASKGFAPLKAGEGRVYFYRSGSMVGSAVQPSIRVNGKVVGDSKPGGFFFVDLPPGPVEVATSTEAEYKVNFVLAAGQTRYVRTVIGMGVFLGHVKPELVDEATGREEIREASYTGPAR